MARKPNKAAEEVVIENDIAKHAEIIENTNNAMATHSTEIMERLGDGLPYEKHRIINEARFYMAQSAEAMLETGKRLLILKEHEPHGEFTEIVSNQLGMEARIAQKMMQASVKFLSPRLAPNAKTFSHLGKSKIYDLMLLDDDVIEELAEGGTVAGLTLDDIDRMSARELRKALRESKEELQAKEDVLADKNKQIDGLQEKVSRIKKVTPDEAGRQLTHECNEYCEDAAQGIRMQVRVALLAVYEHAEANGEEEQCMEFIRDRLDMLQRTLNGVRHELGVDGLEWEA